MEKHDPSPMGEQQRTTDRTPTAKDVSTRLSRKTHLQRHQKPAFLAQAEPGKRPHKPNSTPPPRPVALHPSENPGLWRKHAAGTMGEVAGLEGPPI